MPDKVRYVHVRIGIKEEAFEPGKPNPEDEIAARLTPTNDSAIMGWDYASVIPKLAPTFTVEGFHNQKEGEPTRDQKTSRETEIETQVQSVLERAKEGKPEGLEDFLLDDLVHDTASGIASDINNETLEERVKYLLRNQISEEEILKAFNQAEV